MKRSLSLAAAAAALLLTACSSSGTTGGADAAADASPISVENCGATVTLDAAPERVLLINNDAVPTLAALGVLDRVVATTATLMDGVYDDDTVETLAKAETLTTSTNATGGAIVSQETILELDPDLVIGPENAVDREGLEAAGVAVYSPPSYCADPGEDWTGEADFDRVYAEVRSYGALFDVSDEAEDVVAGLEESVAGIPAPESPATAAALYVSSGGATLSPYGAASMVTPVFAAAGLENVYADVEDRVFDVALSDILERDPSVIVLLYSSGDPQELIDAFAAIDGADALSAVKDGRVVALPYPYTDPPTPMSVAGAERLADEVDALP